MKKRLELFVSIFTLLVGVALPSLLFSNANTYKQANALSIHAKYDEITPNPGATYQTQKIWLSNHIEEQYENYVYYQCI